MKRTASVALATALFAVTIGTEATGHTARVGSHVTFHITDGPGANNVARGKVRSVRNRCEDFRVVEVYRVNDGAANDDLVDTLVTNANGRFRRDPTGLISEGRYYAKATRTVVGGPGHTHVCKRAFSNEQVVVGPDPIR